MGTRCQIVFENIDKEGEILPAKFYQHYDGYPESGDGDIGMVEKLNDAIQRFNRARGVGSQDYLRARILEAIIDPAQYPLGFGIGEAWHWDTAYIYAIDRAGGLHVIDCEAPEYRRALRANKQAAYIAKAIKSREFVTA